MSDDARQPHTSARAPFDDADADIILHTSDHVDFRVFRLILTLSSPFFQGMFALPQPSDAFVRPGITSSPDSKHQLSGTTTNDAPSKQQPPSIDVPEDSSTLDTLLRFLYPNTRAPPFRDLSHARNVAIAASKYVMTTALDEIADKVQAQYVASHPLQVYLIACRMGWESVARAAAKYCLDPTLIPGEALDCDDLLHYPGAGVAYHRLESYRDACRQALEEKFDDLNLFDEDDDEGCEESSDDGREHDGISDYCLGRWTALYLANIRQAVLKCPRKEKLEDFSLTPERSCDRCGIYMASSIASARLEVASRIDDVLSEIQLRFSS